VAADRSSAEARTFDLRHFLMELLPSLRPVLRRHHIQVDCEEGLSMHGQAGALSQVLTNLLINASQHAYPPDQAGTMEIVVRPQGNRVRIEVVDHGYGIPPENIKKVFDPFFTTARGRGGTGLGLHIVYNLVTHTLGGTISVESELGRGSRFIVSLPLRSDPAAA
jgi:signal transduction histidine kinase